MKSCSTSLVVKEMQGQGPRGLITSLRHLEETRRRGTGQEWTLMEGTPAKVRRAGRPVEGREPRIPVASGLPGAVSSFPPHPTSCTAS